MTEENKKSNDEILENIRKVLKEELLEIINEELREIIKQELKIALGKEPIQNPYEILQEWNKKAAEEIKIDLARMIEKNDAGKVELKFKKESERLNKKIDEIIGKVEDLREEERKKGLNLANPLNESKIFSYLPWLKNFTKRATRESNNWLGLLFAGVGVTFIGRGVWDASEELFSIQGSIIIGSFILGLVAWLERRKIFALFGQE